MEVSLIYDVDLEIYKIEDTADMVRYKFPPHIFISLHENQERLLQIYEDVDIDIYSDGSTGVTLTNKRSLKDLLGLFREI